MERQILPVPADVMVFQRWCGCPVSLSLLLAATPPSPSLGHVPACLLRTLHECIYVAEASCATLSFSR